MPVSSIRVGSTVQRPRAQSRGTSTLLKQGTGAQLIALRAATAYGITLRAVATLMGVGAGAKQTAYYHIEALVSVDSVGTVTIVGTTVVVPPILQGATFVAATLVLSSAGADDLTITFTLAGGITASVRIAATIEYVELLGN